MPANFWATWCVENCFRSGLTNLDGAPEPELIGSTGLSGTQSHNHWHYMCNSTPKYKYKYECKQINKWISYFRDINKWTVWFKYILENKFEYIAE